MKTLLALIALFFILNVLGILGFYDEPAEKYIKPAIIKLKLWVYK